ncbi:hypothetical protein MRX96_023473 [Rhipicephalus microplus]
MKVGTSIKLEEADTQLATWTKEGVDVIGKATLLIKYKERDWKLPLLVVRNEGLPQVAAYLDDFLVASESAEEQHKVTSCTKCKLRAASGGIHRRRRDHVRRAEKSAPPDTADPHFQFPVTPALVTRSSVQVPAIPADDGPTSTLPDTTQACRRSTRARRPVLHCGIDC